jgi:tRNA pseudouridine55 synthase
VSDRHRTGILPVEKGPDVTSFQVVAHLRRVLRAPRIGHGGTLDPAATGLLPILIGEATKLTPYLVDLDKEYLATVRLGVATETQDLTGAVLDTRPVPALEAPAIEAALAPFVGVIRQVPPMFSALRRGGKRLYELARRGVEVEREPREVTIHWIRLESVSLPDFVIRVRCGKGTYVRTLAADLGRLLGGGAHLRNLRRIAVGEFTIADAGPPDMAALLPVDTAVRGLPRVVVDSEVAAYVANGRVLPRFDGAGPWAVYDTTNRLLAVYEPFRTAEAKPSVVLPTAPGQ